MFEKYFSNNILTTKSFCGIIRTMSAIGQNGHCSYYFFVYRYIGGSEMYQVLKRDGGTVEFELTKISGAMLKAFEAVAATPIPA